MVSFVKAANRAHELLCDRLKVPHDWVLIRFSEVPYEDYTSILERLTGHCKFLSIDFETSYRHASGEFLVDPEWSHLLV